MCAAEGRILVRGVFVGVLITIVACSVCVNIHTLNHFTVTSDKSKLPKGVCERLYRGGFDYNTVSNVISCVLCVFSLYIAVCTRIFVLSAAGINFCNALLVQSAPIVLFLATSVNCHSEWSIARAAAVGWGACSRSKASRS